MDEDELVFLSYLFSVFPPDRRSGKFLLDHPIYRLVFEMQVHTDLYQLPDILLLIVKLVIR